MKDCKIYPRKHLFMELIKHLTRLMALPHDLVALQVRQDLPSTRKRNNKTSDDIIGASPHDLVALEAHWYICNACFRNH